jgi:acyl-CoA reductase-like NAD-dependent aldehyde dehydrogenase
LKWDDEEKTLADAHSVEYGLTASICTRDASRAYRLAREFRELNRSES